MVSGSLFIAATSAIPTTLSSLLTNYLANIPVLIAKTMPKPYERGPAEKSLHDALIVTHREMARETFPEGSFITPQAFMSTVLLNRIVNLAHYQLIKTAAHLHDQIVWGYLDMYSTRILGLIQLHCPPPTMASPFTTAPLQRSLPNATASSSNTTAVNPPKKRKCGLCRVEGHYSKLTNISSLFVVNSSFQKKSVHQSMHPMTLPTELIRRIPRLDYLVCMHMVTNNYSIDTNIIPSCCPCTCIVDTRITSTQVCILREHSKTCSHQVCYLMASCSSAREYVGVAVGVCNVPAEVSERSSHLGTRVSDSAVSQIKVVFNDLMS